MDDWEKFNETALPEKDEFHISLNTEDITDTVYAHAKREHHDLYLKSDVLLLADIFDNVKKICLEIYELSKFVSAPKLEWQAAFKKTEIELDLLTYIDML